MKQSIPVLMRQSNVVRGLVFAATVPLLIGWVEWVHWTVTGDFRFVGWFFQFANPLLLTGLAVTQCVLAFRAWRAFSPTQPMWAVWGGLTLAAASQSLGTLCAQILGVKTPLNPWPILAADQSWRGFGITLAGPVHLAFLILAYAIVLPVYRSFGWAKGPRWYDWLLICLAAAYVGMQAWDLILVYPDQLKHPGRLLPWLTDPLLLLLLVMAFTLWRSAGGLDGGLTGLCWGFYGLGVFLTLLGDFASWLAWSQRLQPSQVAVVQWYIWLPAYGCFALGPALQLEARRFARSGLQPVKSGG